MSHFDNDSNIINAVDMIMNKTTQSRTKLVQQGVDQVNAHLNDVSVHTLKAAVVHWATAPQMLCIYSTSELLFLKEAMEMELDYRRQERRA